MLTAPTLYGFVVTYHDEAGQPHKQGTLATTPEAALAITRARHPEARLPFIVEEPERP